MSDVIILWDQPLFFENMFKEYGISASVCEPSSLHSPHLPPAKLLIVPTGFTFPEHSSVSKALSDTKTYRKIFDFVERGGVFLLFSPLRQVCACSTKPMISSLACFGVKGEYVQTDVMILKKSPLTESLESTYCDGYFQNFDERFSVVESDENGRPVHLSMSLGDGKIIVSSIHEFLSKTYFDSLLEGPKVKL